MNVVSGKFVQRARGCISVSVTSVPSRTTATGLPRKGVVENTSTCMNARERGIVVKAFPRTGSGVAGSSGTRHRVGRGHRVGDQVGRVLRARGQPDQAQRDPRGGDLVLAEYSAPHRRRVHGERIHAAEASRPAGGGSPGPDNAPAPRPDGR